MIDVNLDEIDQCESDMWLTASDALARLGIKPQSLYASVSRGRVRTKPDPADSRRSLYDSEDVERLAGRAGGRRSAGTIAADAVRWGDPVMPSAISTVVAGRLYYRGTDVAVLSRTATIEDVAELLWEGGVSDARSDRPAAFAEMFALLAARAATDSATYGRSAVVLRTEAADVFAAIAGSGAPLHRRLARVWKRPSAADAIRRTMVLLADHELNASAFATRVAASTGASLAASVLAGLCAFSGPRHGSAALAAEALVADAREKGAETAVRDWLAQGRAVPAFGHRLYPQGDIRATELLGHIDVPAVHRDVIAAVDRLVGERPNVDFALAAVCAAHGLPKAAPVTMFALARLVGWLAHALEQAASGALIRPRARYTGPRIDPRAAGE